MKTLRMVCLIVCVGFCVARAKDSRADEWDRKTTVTFSAPVQLPGVVLPAGTYIFKRLDQTSNRNITAVLSVDKKKVYALIRTIPDYRIEPYANTTILFGERAAGAPPPVREWFFAGDNWGQEFVYSTPTMLARTSDLQDSSQTAGLQNPTPEVGSETRPVLSADLWPQVEPRDNGGMSDNGSSEQENALADVPPLPQDEAEQPGTTPTQPAMMQLPKTASNLPLIGLAGILSLAAGLTLRFSTKRIK